MKTRLLLFLRTAGRQVLAFLFCLLCREARPQELAAVKAGPFSQQKEAATASRKPLREVLKSLEATHKISFFYSDHLLEGKSVTAAADFTGQSLEQHLEALLKPFGLRFRKLVGSTYVIFREVPPAEKLPEKAGKAGAGIPMPMPVPGKGLSLGVQAGGGVAAISISGRVTSAKGEPLPGVTVVIKGTTVGTTTGSDGSYSLQVADGGGVLVFSFIGFATKEVAVPTSAATLDVTLQEDTKALEEVVVVGYGTARKVNLTGAVDQVSSEVLQNRPVTNVARGLQGVIPNLNIANAGGSANADPSLNIRGTTSINGGGPLVLVDNVQMDLNLLNPDDIESITVLKDAASAAIYGARGAFGVILVTLKKGARDRKPVISYSGGMEFNRPTYLPDMLSSLEYMQSTNIARQRRFGNTVYSDQQIEWMRARASDPANNPNYHTMPNGSIFWHENVDNFREMLQDWAPARNHSLNVNGGAEKVSYYASLGYRDQEGMYRDATDVFKRYNVLINVNTNVTPWLKMGFKTTYTHKNYDEPHRYAGKGSSWWEQMGRGAPQILFPIRTPADAPVPNAPTEHFYNFLNSGARTVTGTEMGMYSINTEIDLVKGLKLKGDFNYQSLNQLVKDVQKEFGFIRDRWQLQNNQTTPSYAERRQTHANYFAANAYLTYDKDLNQHHYVSALLGFNQEWNKRQSFYVQGQNLVSNQVPVLRLITGEIYTGDSETDWAIRGVFSRFHYNYRQRYLLEVNGRYDGTSRFPRESRFHFFPSFSAGWNMAEEAFMNKTRQVLHVLKFRASYGSLGNQNLSSAYPYITSFGVVNPVRYILGAGLPLGLTPPDLVSPDLTWETSSTINFGLDATLWGKLDISFDRYKRTTSDMLVSGEKLPAVLGVASPSRNSAELQTVGSELSLKWRDKTDRDLVYDVGLVVSDYRATINKYGNNPNRLYSTYYEGQQLGEIWGYQTVGIFTSPDQVAKAPSHTQLNGVPRKPGDIEYADLNNDGVINWGNNTVDNPGDKRIIGNSTPRYQFGLSSNLMWKGFDLRVLLQGVGKRDVYPTGNYFWGQIYNGGAVGRKELYHNTWSEENPGAYYPIYKQNSAFNVLEQTRYLQSAAYLRMKNLTLGYAVPAAVIKPIHVQKVRVYCSAENLWERSRLRGGFDPEVISSEEGQAGTLGQFYPLQRTLSFGLQVVL